MRLAKIRTGNVDLMTGACFAESGNHVICVLYEPEQMTREGFSCYFFGRPSAVDEESAVEPEAQSACNLAPNPMW